MFHAALFESGYRSPMFGDARRGRVHQNPPPKMSLYLISDPVSPTIPNTKQKVILYARVSTTDQSYDSQLTELREYASRRGWTQVEEIVGTVSGARSSRKGLDRLMAAVRRGRSTSSYLARYFRDNPKRNDKLRSMTFDKKARLLRSIAAANEGFRPSRRVDLSGDPE